MFNLCCRERYALVILLWLCAVSCLSNNCEMFIYSFDEPVEEVIYPKGILMLCPLVREMLIYYSQTLMYLKNQIQPEERNRFHFFNGFFFRKLADMDKDPNSASDGRAAFLRVRKWTRKVDIFEKDFIFEIGAVPWLMDRGGAVGLMGVVAVVGSDWFDVIQTYSSSSSNSFPAPKMADGDDINDPKLWPAALEKHLILILLLEETTGNIPNGQMKNNRWPFVVDQFNHQTGKRYLDWQIRQKFKRLKQRYFSLVRAERARSDAESSNCKCKELRHKGLDHFDLLEQLFKTGTASTTQPDSPDDVVKVPHPDMGQGSNPKGKQPAHSNTFTGKKRKAIDAIMEMELSKKTETDSQKTVESPDPFSMPKAVEILNPMFGGRLSESTLHKFLLILEKPEVREAFITMKAERRQGFIEHYCR
ncbi:hypothetical protein SO802_024938 [Lithocarpus litseifolius]|uniref:Ubiquitin-like protease family profile domain-containing protein n=1 Tax=Lithocarpus litseifolius TaxID=425828 RepID=A0AAW2BWX1_9ROSI